MKQLAKPGDFCPNEICLDYEKLQTDQGQAEYYQSRKDTERSAAFRV